MPNKARLEEDHRVFNLPDFEGSIESLVAKLKSDGWSVTEKRIWEYDILENQRLGVKLDSSSGPNAGEIDHMTVTATHPKLMDYLARVRLDAPPSYAGK